MTRTDRENRISEWQQLQDYIREFVVLLRKRYDWKDDVKVTTLVWGSPRACTCVLTVEDYCHATYKELKLDVRNGTPDTWFPQWDSRSWHVRQF